MIRKGKFFNVTIAEIREVAQSIGKRACQVSKWVNDRRRAEAAAWVEENRQWLKSIKVNEYFEDIIARMPAGLETGNKEIDDYYEKIVYDMVKQYQQDAAKAKYRRGSRRAEFRRSKR